MICQTEKRVKYPPTRKEKENNFQRSREPRRRNNVSKGRLLNRLAANAASNGTWARHRLVPTSKDHPSGLDKTSNRLRPRQEKTPNSCKVIPVEIIAELLKRNY